MAGAAPGAGAGAGAAFGAGAAGVGRARPAWAGAPAFTACAQPRVGLASSATIAAKTARSLAIRSRECALRERAGFLRIALGRLGIERKGAMSRSCSAGASVTTRVWSSKKPRLRSAAKAGRSTALTVIFRSRSRAKPRARSGQGTSPGSFVFVRCLEKRGRSRGHVGSSGVGRRRNPPDGGLHGDRDRYPHHRHRQREVVHGEAEEGGDHRSPRSWMAKMLMAIALARMFEGTLRSSAALMGDVEMKRASSHGNASAKKTRRRWPPEKHAAASGAASMLLTAHTRSATRAEALSSPAALRAPDPAVGPGPPEDRPCAAGQHQDRRRTSPTPCRAEARSAGTGTSAPSTRSRRWRTSAPRSRGRRGGRAGRAESVAGRSRAARRLADGAPRRLDDEEAERRRERARGPRRRRTPRATRVLADDPADRRSRAPSRSGWPRRRSRASAPSSPAGPCRR